jgi:hypothetical protein
MLVHDIHIAGAKELEGWSSAERNIILDTDMKLALNDYLSSLATNPQDIHTIVDIIVFTQSHPLEERSARNTEVFERAAFTSSTTYTCSKRKVGFWAREESNVRWIGISVIYCFTQPHPILCNLPQRRGGVRCVVCRWGSMARGQRLRGMGLGWWMLRPAFRGFAGKKWW